jgi:hypothetical protein
MRFPADPRRQRRSVRTGFVQISVLIASCLSQLPAQQAAPSIRITEPAAVNGAVFTNQPAISLSGVATGVAGITQVKWQKIGAFGDQASVEREQIVDLTVSWSTGQIGLRPGANFVKVEAIDSSNQHAEAAVVVYYTPADAPLPSHGDIQSSFYRGVPVTYQVKDGLAIFQGDIVLGTASQMEQARLLGPGGSRRGVGGHVPGRVHPEGSTIAFSSEQWTKVAGVTQVPYTISAETQGVSAAVTNINNAISTFNATFSGVIHWVARTAQTSYVIFDLSPSDFSGVCESSVGMVPLADQPQTAYGSINCGVPTLLHEMGHVIGSWHEQSRVDRNSYVNIITANIDKPLLSNFDQVTIDEEDMGLYDYASIMHYFGQAFSVDGLATTIESTPVAGITLSNSSGYSSGDIDSILRLYGAVPSQVTVDANPTGAQVIVDGTTYTTPHAFSWALNSTHTLDIPAGKQTVGGATYMFGRWNIPGGIAASQSITVSPGAGTVYAPATAPAATLYAADFVRLHPFGTSAFPSGLAGTVAGIPAPTITFSGTNYYVDRQQASIQATPNSGYSFYSWFNSSLYNYQTNPYNFPVLTDMPNMTGGFTTHPVTTVTGTASPGAALFAGFSMTVDGNFVQTPAVFATDVTGDASWTALSAHTIDATAGPQSPVTFNVSYAFANWSDGLSQSHTVHQGAAGTNQTFTATYTPTWRAIVDPSPYCGGTISPTAAFSSSSDSQIPDGTVQPYTANAATGFQFMNWGGDLSGSANPVSPTIHSELLGTAFFNVTGTTAPITVTGISPASSPASAGVTTLNITGTGFSTTGAFFTYWDLNPRSFTVNSSTSASVTLHAGDLATPGYHRLTVENFSNGCTAFVDSTYAITSGAVGTPSTVTANAGTTPQSAAINTVFGNAPAVTVTDAGSNPVSGVNVTFTAPNSGASGLFSNSTVTITMATNGSGVASAPFTANGTAGGPYTVTASVVGVATPASFSLTNMPGPQTISFGALSNRVFGTAPFTVSATASSGLTVSFNSQTMAVCTVSVATVTLVSGGTCIIQATQAGNTNYAAATPVNQSFQVTPVLQAVSVTPSSGSGATQTFSFVYSDTNGASDLGIVQVVVNASLSGYQGCYISVDPVHKTLLLLNDGATAWQGPITLPTSGTLANSQCTINGGSSSIVLSGNNATVNLGLSFSASFGGVKNVYGYAQAAGGVNSGWTALGTWTVPTIQAVSVTPSTGTGSSNTFSFLYSDRNGASDLGVVQVVVNASLSGYQGCYISIDPVHKTLLLLNDGATAWQGPITLPTASTLGNSQCTINGGSSSIALSGNNATVNLALSFSSSFGGVKTVYGYAQAAGGLNSGWIALGNWTVSAGPPQAVSVTPSTGTGSSNTFSFLYSDANGASDLGIVQVVINASLSGYQGCYISIDPVHKTLLLLNDGATAWQGPITLPTSGTLANSQCTINGGSSSIALSGNNATVNLALSFSGSFGGAKSVYGYAQAANGLNSGWTALGNWTVPAVQAVSVTPSTGTGSSNTFSFVYSDANGASDLGIVQVVVNSSLSGYQGCYISIDPVHKTLLLLNDGATAWQGPITLPTASTLANSQCTINGGSSSIALSGNNATVNLALSFSSGFGGAKNVYGYAQAAGGLNSGWTALGNWTVPTIQAVSVTPSTGTGFSNTFSFVFSDANGASDLGIVQVVINSSLSGYQGCYVSIDPVHKTLLLLNDGATAWQGPITLPTSGTLANSQCTVNGGSSSIALSGNNATVNLALSFSGSFGGAKSVYGYAQAANGLNSGWTALGNWTVP